MDVLHPCQTWRFFVICSTHAVWRIDLGGISPRSIFCVFFLYRKSLNGILLANTRWEQSIGRQHTTAKESIDIASNAGPWTEWPQLFRYPCRADWRPCFRGRARVRGVVACFQQQRRHSTVSMLAPASTQQQGNTHNRGTYRYSVQRGTMDSSVHKRPVIGGRRRPGVRHKHIWTLL